MNRYTRVQRVLTRTTRVEPVTVRPPLTYPVRVKVSHSSVDMPLSTFLVAPGTTMRMQLLDTEYWVEVTA